MRLKTVVNVIGSSPVVPVIFEIRTQMMSTTLRCPVTVHQYGGF